MLQHPSLAYRNVQFSKTKPKLLTLHFKTHNLRLQICIEFSSETKWSIWTNLAVKVDIFLFSILKINDNVAPHVYTESAEG